MRKVSSLLRVSCCAKENKYPGRPAAGSRHCRRKFGSNERQNTNSLKTAVIAAAIAITTSDSHRIAVNVVARVAAFICGVLGVEIVQAISRVKSRKDTKRLITLLAIEVSI